MKLFFTIFAAILAAVGVIFGFYSYQKQQEKDHAAILSLAQTSKRVVDSFGADCMENKPDPEKVDRFKNQVIQLRNLLKQSNFPKLERKQFDDFLDEAVSHVKDFLETKDKDLAKKLEGL